MEAAKTYPKLKKAPKYRFVAFILMTLVYILTYAGLQVFNSAGTQIMNDFGIRESFLPYCHPADLLQWQCVP